MFNQSTARQVICIKLKSDIGRTLRELWERTGVNIIEAECCLNNIHMPVDVPLNLGVSSFMGDLNNKSSLMIFDKYGNLKYEYGNLYFRCRGHLVDIVVRYERVKKNIPKIN